MDPSDLEFTVSVMLFRASNWHGPDARVVLGRICQWVPPTIALPSRESWVKTCPIAAYLLGLWGWQVRLMSYRSAGRGCERAGATASPVVGRHVILAWLANRTSTNSGPSADKLLHGTPALCVMGALGGPSHQFARSLLDRRYRPRESPPQTGLCISESDRSRGTRSADPRPAEQVT